MSFLIPETGLVFWMFIAFGIVLLILYKYGFPIIVSMVEERKRFIDDALRNAKEANERLASVEKQSNEIIRSAHDEQTRILREVAITRDRLIKEAKERAESEGERMIAETRRIIRQEKEEALDEIRNEVAELSMLGAEKVLRKELDNDVAQSDYACKLLDEVLTEKGNKK